MNVEQHLAGFDKTRNWNYSDVAGFIRRAWALGRLEAFEEAQAIVGKPSSKSSQSNEEA